MSQFVTDRSIILSSFYIGFYIWTLRNQLRPAAVTTLGTTIRPFPQSQVILVGFSEARLQVKTFTTVAADKKPVTVFFIRGIIAIGNTGISTQSIQTCYVRDPNASIMVALNAALVKSRVNLTEEVMAQAGAVSIGVSATVANDV
uniref:Uncharacterized protein n=1 Tax=Micrurus surinamensis TaxID=129470 RepID=A0A2D4PCI7_MICSU